MPGTNLIDGWRSFGFKADYNNGKILVISLFKGLSADNANLKIDDEVIAVNGQKLNCNTYCECMTLLAKLFDDNTKLVLDIKSGQTIKEITVTKDQVD